MSPREVRQLVFLGFLLLFLGLVAGLPFHDAITASRGPDAVRAWRVAHTSLVGLGALYLAIAAVADHLVLGRRAAALAVRGLVLTAYASVFAFILGPAVGARGLEPVGRPLNVLVFVAFAVAILASFVAIAVCLRGAWAGWAATPATGRTSDASR